MAKRSERTSAVERADSVEMARRAQEVARMAAGPNPPTRQELADLFKITPRAVSNLIEYARQIGIDLDTKPRADGKRAYTLRGGMMLDRPMSVSEAIASLTLTEAVIGTPLAADPQATQETAHRLRGAIRKDVDAQLARLQGRFAVRMLKAAKPADPTIFATVMEGIMRNRVLAVDYESTASKRDRARGSAGGADAAGGGGGARARARAITTVEIEPYGVFFAKRSWYLVARKRGAQEMRMYKLARFRRVMATELEFELPRGWNIDAYLADTWEVVRDPKAPRSRVVVDVEGDFAATVEETRWHPSQRATPLAGGAVRFSFEVAGLSEVLYWILSMGAHATPVSPPELVDAVREEIARMHARTLRATGARG
ncbi:MAG: WYL domain-containing protein [Phycisphaerales bacterium]